jgi:DNA protecting protein DprA
MNEPISFHILRLLETPGIGPAKVSAVLAFALENHADLNAILEKPTELKGLLTAKQVEELSNNFERISTLYATIRLKGVKLIATGEPDYPERLQTLLGQKAPPLLMVLGNELLFEKPAVGFCGSRKASEKGLATAWDCSDQLAHEGINIVSGYAVGVDMAAHRTALECDGATVLVLCEGILHFNIKKDFKDIWDWERIVVVSEFLPGIPWSVRNAMQRNRTICALSRAMILIESASTGGSIEAGRASLSMGVPLFAPVYEGMPESAVGNRELLDHGARPLLKSRTTGRANMKDVFAAVFENEFSTGHIHYPIADDKSSQLVLFEQNNKGYAKK